MPNFEKTLANNEKRRLASTYNLLAGVDGAKVPQFVKIDADGRLHVTMEAQADIPPYDSITLEYYGSTNNLRYIRYRTGSITGTVVAYEQLFYAGGGATDNDTFTGSTLTVV